MLDNRTGQTVTRFTEDGDKDAIAVIRASLNRDEVAMLAIVNHCELLPMLHSMAEMFSHGCRRGANEPIPQLDRYLANVSQFVAFHNQADREVEERRAWRAANPLPTASDQAEGSP